MTADPFESPVVTQRTRRRRHLRGGEGHGHLRADCDRTASPRKLPW